MSVATTAESSAAAAPQHEASKVVVRADALTKVFDGGFTNIEAVSTLVIPITSVLTAVAALLPACVPPAEFAAPISEPGSVEHDRRLVGSWYALMEDDAVIYLNIGESGDGLLNGVAIMTQDRPDHLSDADTTIKWLAAIAWPSEIDGELYYSVERKKDLGHYYDEFGKPGFIVARAAFPDDDTLRLTVISSDKIADLIRDGRVPGQVVDGKFSIISWADVGGAELRTLIRSYPAEQLFRNFPVFAGASDPPEFVFQRLKPPIQKQ
ncbi:MAG: hypothetical protein OEO83_13260 [Alphaproteobacteria bacterium]|nr:hypothetical protein [Alphaproteobacteria bacterium]